MPITVERERAPRNRERSPKIGIAGHRVRVPADDVMASGRPQVPEKPRHPIHAVLTALLIEKATVRRLRPVCASPPQRRQNVGAECSLGLGDY